MDHSRNRATSLIESAGEMLRLRRLQRKSRSNLCWRCYKVDLDELLIGKEVEFHSIGSSQTVEIEFERQSSLSLDHYDSFVPFCVLCQFFKAMCPESQKETLEVQDSGPGQALYPESDDEDVPYFVGQLAITSHCKSSDNKVFFSPPCIASTKSIRYLVTWCGSNWTRGHPFCAVNPPSLKSLRHHHADTLVQGRMIEPDLIDYSILRDWIASCQKEHSQCHGPPSIPLKVIDCKQHTIVRLQDHVPYLALSYVWGKLVVPDYEDSSNGALPSILPTTVEDAIKVTMELQYEYLWVDRYCISQHGDEKAKEIERMDEIYQGAEAVIIDAVGEDPRLGLPGVSRIRSSQPRVSIGAQTLVSLFKYPINHIRSSKWASRGWTYQEAVLARRRLFFTRDQVYFECRVHGCMETLCKPLVHTVVGGPSIVSARHSPQYTVSPPLCQFLAEYSKRDLSYPSDGLNAFLGVLRAFEKQDYPIRHYWGVPILRILSYPVSEPEVSPLRGFLRGLCWSSSDSTSIRRPQFPSWSWAGWDFSGGGVTYHDPKLALHCSLARLQVSLGDEMLDWECFWRSHEHRASTYHFYAKFPPSRLRVSGRAVSFQARREPDACNHCSGFTDLQLEQYAVDTKQPGKTPIVRAYLQQASEALQTFTAVVLGEAPVRLGGMTSTMLGDGEKIGESYQPYLIVLLLLRTDDDVSPPSPAGRTFERVGLLELTWRSIQDYESSNWFLEARERDIVIV